MDGGASGKPLGVLAPTTLPHPSLREAKRRGNPELRKYTLDFRASLAMTEDGMLVSLGIIFVLLWLGLRCRQNHISCAVRGLKS